MPSPRFAENAARAFLERRKAHAGAFRSSGDFLVSYALRLAHWADVGIPGRTPFLVLDHDLLAPQCSATTTRHVRAFLRVLLESGIETGPRSFYLAE